MDSLAEQLRGRVALPNMTEDEFEIIQDLVNRHRAEDWANLVVLRPSRFSKSRWQEIIECAKDVATKPMVTLDEPEKPKSILAEAEEIVNGARAVDYEDSTANMLRIASITELMLTEAEWAALGSRQFTATVIAKVLMAVKLGREAHKHKRDNLVDLCGYAHILEIAENVQ